MSEDAIFARAAKLTGKAREEYLREACGDNQDMRRRIDKLLVTHDNPDGSLEPDPQPTQTVDWDDFIFASCGGEIDRRTEIVAAEVVNTAAS